MVTKGGGRELAEGMAGEENKQLDRRGRKERRLRLEVITCRMNKECILYKKKGHVQQMWTRCTRP